MRAGSARSLLVELSATMVLLLGCQEVSGLNDLSVSPGAGNEGSCADGRRNGNETDVDCGGSCKPCADGLACGSGKHCQSSVCTGGICQPPTCSDGERNGSESDNDCGGDCQPCSSGKSCSSAADCLSAVCSAGECQEPSCSDGVRNGDEVNQDCGGTCPGCPDGSDCKMAADCASGVCSAGKCRPPDCTDGVKGAGETDVDCGGKICPACGPGKSCQSGSDCSSEVCMGGKCTIVLQIAAGATHTCALLDNGKIYCWGGNGSGQLGDGTTDGRSTPGPVLDLTDATAVAVGGGPSVDTKNGHSCALLKDQTAVCWGRGGQGQLGNGALSSSSKPVVVSGLSGALETALGREHTCARAGSAVQCWGANGYGQLGTGDQVGPHSSPVDLAINDAAGLALGANHTCVLRSDKTISCAGDGGDGQLGLGTTNKTSTLTKIFNLQNVTQVAASANSTCALLAGDSAQCWGDNSNAQLGTGNTTDSLTPAFVQLLLPIVEIRLGGNPSGSTGGHACARLLDKSVDCWGGNASGQVGDGSIASPKTSPVPVPALSGVVQLALGTGFSCALLETGAVRCWGRNDKGQLGTGKTDSPILAPTPVVWP